MDLNDICYQHIKDTFHYGAFGDFRLVVDRSTGCFNATKLCDMTGKKFFHWKRLEKSKRLIAFYENESKRCPPDVEGIFYEIKAAQYHESKLITGQYLCKELLLDVASWISVEFYDKCSKIVNDYLISESKQTTPNIAEIENRMRSLKLANEAYEEEVKQKQDKIDELLELSRQQEERSRQDYELIKQQEERSRQDHETIQEMKIRLDEIHDQNEVLMDQNCELEAKLDVAVEDRVPKTASPQKLEQFILLKKNDDSSHEFQYHVICGQTPYCASRLRHLAALHPNMTSLLNLNYQPNTKNLFCRFKEKHASRKDCVVRMNGIKLKALTEAGMVESFEELNEIRYNC